VTSEFWRQAGRMHCHRRHQGDGAWFLMEQTYVDDTTARTSC
jgi:hypothetical protein